MVYDVFSHYLVTIPIRDKRPDTVARGLSTQYLMPRSCPRRVHSDRGEKFISPFLQELNRLMSVEQLFCSFYRPQSGGRTERSHRFLNDASSIQIHENDQKDWDL